MARDVVNERLNASPVAGTSVQLHEEGDFPKRGHNGPYVTQQNAHIEELAAKMRRE